MTVRYESIADYNAWIGSDTGPSTTESYWIVVRDADDNSLITIGPLNDKAVALNRCWELMNVFGSWSGFASSHDMIQPVYINRRPTRLGGFFVATTPVFHPKTDVR